MTALSKGIKHTLQIVNALRENVERNTFHVYSDEKCTGLPFVLQV
jgi:hypothetical protein